MKPPDSPNNNPDLTHGALLVRNTVLNLLGRGAPMLLAIVAIPLLIRQMGADRFGILTLAWIVIGYFSLFDLGMGRALTKLVAERVHDERDPELPGLAWTALGCMLLLGVLGTLILAPLSPFLVKSVLKIPESLQAESLTAFYVLALSLPVVVSTAGLRGILEAKQRFELINIVRVNLGVLTYLGPLLVLPFTNKLTYIVGVLAAGRVLAWFVYFILCLKHVPVLREKISVQRKHIVPLLRFGGWLTVSNFISPLLEYLDRFIIGVLISVTAVAFYVTPYEVVTRLLIIPGAVVAVMFPAFSASFVHNKQRTSQLFSKTVKWIHLLIFPLALVLIGLARQILQVWIGPEFARQSTLVMQCLTLGVFINSIAYVPSALLQGIGRPDLTAKFHLLELPIYLVLLYFMIIQFGITGAAIAWLARVLLDATLLLEFTRRLLPRTQHAIQRSGAILAGSLVLLALAMLPLSLLAKAAYLILAFVGFSLASWFVLMDAEDRSDLRGWLHAGLLAVKIIK